MINKVPYGLTGAIPDDAVAAWGARAIVSQEGYVQLPADQQGGDGGDLAGILLDVLKERLPRLELVAVLGDALRAGWLHCRRTEDVVLFMDDVLTVVANTNGSDGYCYLAAWIVSTPAEIRLEPAAPGGVWLQGVGAAAEAVAALDAAPQGEETHEAQLSFFWMTVGFKMHKLGVTTEQMQEVFISGAKTYQPSRRVGEALDPDGRTVEFSVMYQRTVEVARSLVPAEWMDGTSWPPKRLWNWPSELVDDITRQGVRDVYTGDLVDPDEVNLND